MRTFDYYQTALDSNTDILRRAYEHAQARAFDMRYKAETREAAREYLPQLTAELRRRIETEKPAGGVI
jgi:hypothetical protein